MQMEITAEATIKGKIKFERHMQEFGHIVRVYHMDNGIFVTYDCSDHCKQQGQSLTVVGVQDHHQNGLAEETI